MIPNVVVIISTALLLRKARSSVKEKRKGLKWQGIITVVMTSVIYTVSYLPFNLYFMLEPHLEKDPVSPGPFFIQFYRVANGFVIINVLSNFFVYSLTVASFRQFVKMVAWRIVLLFLCKNPYQNRGDNFLVNMVLATFRIALMIVSDPTLVVEYEILSGLLILTSQPSIWGGGGNSKKV